MRVIVGKYPPREAGADDVWIATVPKMIGRGHVATGRWRKFTSSRLQGMPFATFWAITTLIVRGGSVDNDDLLNCVYDNPEDGGPLSRSIDANLCRIRQSMRALGIEIRRSYPGLYVTYA